MSFVLGTLIIIALASLAYGAYEAGGRRAAELEATVALKSAMRWRNAYYSARGYAESDGPEPEER